MTVELGDLQKILEIIFKHLEAQGVSAVKIEEDYYWNVPAEEVYDPLKSPADLDLGQLTDDWTRLESIGKGESPAIGYALAWAAPVLRKIAEQNIA